MISEVNKKVVLRFNKEFLEEGNTEVLKEIVADDFTNHTAAGNVPKDVSGLVQFVGMLHKHLVKCILIFMNSLQKMIL
jgi:predicted SnoaL-like aldol condensation-catalyzing enzyme